MNETPAPAVPPLPPGATVNVPLLYADAVIDAKPGAFTSKIVFGVNHGPFHAPTLQVVMPTDALLQAARKIVEMLTQPETIAGVEKQTTAFLNVARGFEEGK